MGGAWKRKSYKIPEPDIDVAAKAESPRAATFLAFQIKLNFARRKRAEDWGLKAKENDRTRAQNYPAILLPPGRRHRHHRAYRAVAAAEPSRT